MLDLHCHILPAVDDGPATLAEALRLARFCVADGITHVTATPHCHRYLRLMRRDVLPHVARFRAELERAGVPLTVLPGSEVQITDAEEFRLDFEAGLYCTLGDGLGFVLVECPWNEHDYADDMPDAVEWLVRRGVQPILAHPERQDYLDRRGRSAALVEAGAWPQLTVDSLLGNFGPSPLRSAKRLLELDWPFVLATDAHGRDRCSGLSAGYAWVARHCGAERAAAMRERSDSVLRGVAAVA